MSLTRNASFRQLATFHAVARLGSLSAAAEEMHLTPPAVSLQIGALEASANTPLLQRSGRGVRLTEAGVLLAEYASRILALWLQAEEDLATLQGIVSSTLRVGAVTTAEYLLPRLLVAFVDRHPKVQLKLHIGNRDEVVRLLAVQEIDVAIMGRAPAELKTTAKAFARHPMAFVAAPSHPLMAAAREAARSRRKLGVEAMADVSLMVRERGSGTRATVERLFKDARVALRPRSELSSNEALKQMCAAGFGVAFLSLHTCALELETGLLSVLPIAGTPIKREWFVMHLASRQLAGVPAAFEQFLIEQVSASLAPVRSAAEVPSQGAKRSRARAKA